MTTNTHNTVHKKYQYILHQIKKILQRNNLTIAKAVRVKQNKKKQDWIAISNLFSLLDYDTYLTTRIESTYNIVVRQSHFYTYL